MEAELGDPLERPASHDRLAGRVPRGVVVQAALGAAVGVAARPAGGIDRIDRQATVQRVAGQQVAELLGIDAAAGQGGIRAAPATTVHRLKTQVSKRRDRRRAQQRVSQLQQGMARRVQQAYSSARKPASRASEEDSSAMTAQPDLPDGYKQPDQHERLHRVKSQAHLS